MSCSHVESWKKERKTSILHIRKSHEEKKRHLYAMRKSDKMIIGVD